MASFFFKKNKGFTLIEVLVSIVIIGIIASGVLPLMVDSFRTIYRSAEINKEVLDSEATMQRGLYKDTTYQGTTYPVKFSAQDPVVDIKGSLVETESKDNYGSKYISFMADKAYIKIDPFALIEGYRPLESGNNPAKINIEGYNTHFTADDTVLEIYDRNGNLVSGDNYSLKEVIEDPAEDFDSGASIELDSGLRNAGSPYTIKLETDYSMIAGDTEIVRARLPINLPRFLAGGDSGATIVSNKGDYWGEHDSSGDIRGILKGDERYLAFGKAGKINVLENENEWDSYQLEDGFQLNDGIYYEEANNNIYELVSSGGTIAKAGQTVANKEDWSTIPSAPEYKEEIPELDNNPGVYFDGQKRSLNFHIAGEVKDEEDEHKEIDNKITGSQDRTLIMVVKPEESAELLFDITDADSNGEGERWTLLRNKENKLRFEIDNSAYIKIDYELENNKSYIISVVLAGTKLKDHIVYINGEKFSQVDPEFSITNGERNVATAADRAYLGYQLRDNKIFKGDIAEVILYNKALERNVEDEENEDLLYLDEIYFHLAEKYDISVDYETTPPESGHEPEISDPDLTALFKGESLSLADEDKVFKWPTSIDTANDDDKKINDDAELNDTALNGMARGVVDSDQKTISIAVGKNGRVLRREDNGDWNFVESLTNKLNDICFTGLSSINFIAVGEENDDNKAVIFTSSDGELWTEIDIDIAGGLNSIISRTTDNGTELLAVGDSPDNEEAVILSSDDGSNWQRESSGTYLNLNDIAYKKIDNSIIYLAVGGSDKDKAKDSVILYSNDGKEWREISSPTDNRLYGIGK